MNFSRKKKAARNDKLTMSRARQFVVLFPFVKKKFIPSHSLAASLIVSARETVRNRNRRTSSTPSPFPPATLLQLPYQGRTPSSSPQRGEDRRSNSESKEKKQKQILIPFPLPLHTTLNNLLTQRWFLQSVTPALAAQVSARPLELPPPFHLKHKHKTSVRSTSSSRRRFALSVRSSES